MEHYNKYYDNNPTNTPSNTPCTLDHDFAVVELEDYESLDLSDSDNISNNKKNATIINMSHGGYTPPEYAAKQTSNSNIKLTILSCCIGCLVGIILMCITVYLLSRFNKLC
jgi:hypothetical protein